MKQYLAVVCILMVQIHFITPVPLPFCCWLPMGMVSQCTRSLKTPTKSVSLIFNGTHMAGFSRRVTGIGLFSLIYNRLMGFSWQTALIVWVSPLVVGSHLSRCIEKTGGLDRNATRNKWRHWSQLISSANVIIQVIMVMYQIFAIISWYLCRFYFLGTW